MHELHLSNEALHLFSCGHNQDNYFMPTRASTWGLNPESSACEPSSPTSVMHFNYTQAQATDPMLPAPHSQRHQKLSN